MLQRERYSSDIPDAVYGLHSQAVVWQGCAGWRTPGRRRATRRSRRPAAVSPTGSAAGFARRCASRSAGLPDGSLFVPSGCSTTSGRTTGLTEARRGQLLEPRHAVRARVGPVRPGKRRSRGALCATCDCTARGCSGSSAPAPTRSTAEPAVSRSGTDQVYGINVARFLADNDEPDQLVLSLYGQLAAAMTPGTFVAGEAASVAPLRGETTARCTCRRTAPATRRSSARCGCCSCTRRSTLRGLRPGLELAYATPRAWLEAGEADRGASASRPASARSRTRSGRRRARSTRRSTCRTRAPRNAPAPAPPAARFAHHRRRARRPAVSRLQRSTETIEVPARPGRVEIVARLDRGE